MNKKLLWGFVIGLVIVGALILMLRFTCTLLEGLGDRGLDFEGYIYEWVDAPPGSESLVYIGETLDSITLLQSKDVRPIESAGTVFTTMYIWHGKLIDFREIKSGNIHPEPIGQFNLDDFGAMPTKEYLRVERNGYKTVISDEFRVGGRYRLIVILVRQN